MPTRSWNNLGCLFLAMTLAGCSSVMRGAPAVDRELATLVADPVHGVASLSVAVVSQGKLSYQAAFGQRFIHPSDPALNQAANVESLYRIASVSKFVTTLGVMRLVEAGKLSLDRDVGDYLGYRLRHPAFPDQTITLRMLLSHTSSLRDEAGYSWPAAVSLASAISARPGAWDARQRPGAWFSYSNLNWGVIGTVMEAASGERFDLLMRRLVLDPLGIRGGYNVAALAPPELANLAALYRKRAPDAASWPPSGPWIAQVDDYHAKPAALPTGIDQYTVGTNGTLFSPTGGLRIAAPDLARILLMLLDEGRHEGRQFLSSASVQAMFSSQWRFNPAAPNGDTHQGLFTQWGLGVQRFGDERSKLFPGMAYPAWGHLGDAYGLFSVFAVNFADRSGVVVLMGGTAVDPATTPGSYSALSRQEELVLSALQRLLPARP